MTPPSARRGDVWLARLDKVRPVIILARDPLGRILKRIIVVPVTSTRRGLSTEVAVEPADGVRQSSVANLDTLGLLSRDRLIRRVGRLRETTLAALCDALAVAVGCD